MPSRKKNSSVLSQPSVIPSLSNEKFVFDLKEAEQSLLELSMAAETLAQQVASEPSSDQMISNVSDAVPLMTRIYESLIGDISIFPDATPAVQNEIKSIVDPVQISLREVRRHDSFDDCWVVIYDRVYDITTFLQSHPGGYDVILEHAGRDATIAFRGSGHSGDAVRMLKKFEIGILPMEERLYRHETLIFRWGELPE